MKDDDENETPSPLAHPPKLPDAGVYDGPARAAPYGLSRLAPSFSLVDVAAEIEKADSMLATTTGGKLGVIAEQIRRLQEQARVMLERAQRDAELHRARCSFQKKPGGVYHLYRKDVTASAGSRCSRPRSGSARSRRRTRGATASRPTWGSRGST